MSGIYTMALITVAATLLIVGAPSWLTAPKKDRRLMLWFFLLQLPMSALAFYFFRLPLDAGVKELGLELSHYRFVTSWYAPLTEEPAKLLPLLLPVFYRRLSRENAVPLGLALGLGFGIGEVGFLAWKIAQAPAVAGLPWHIFSGFLVERILVCFLHGAMTAIILGLWFKGIKWGILVSMVMHYLLNLPIYLAALGTFGWGRPIWTSVALIWIVLMVIVGAFAITFLHKGKSGMGAMVGGPRDCPGCGKTYKPGPFGLNLVFKRYEKCPHCRKWHMV